MIVLRASSMVSQCEGQQFWDNALKLQCWAPRQCASVSIHPVNRVKHLDTMDDWSWYTPAVIIHDFPQHFCNLQLFNIPCRSVTKQLGQHLETFFATIFAQVWIAFRITDTGILLMFTCLTPWTVKVPVAYLMNMTQPSQFSIPKNEPWSYSVCLSVWYSLIIIPTNYCPGGREYTCTVQTL